LWVPKLNNVLALNFSCNPLVLNAIGAREKQQQTFLQLLFYQSATDLFPNRFSSLDQGSVMRNKESVLHVLTPKKTLKTIRHGLK